MIASASSAQQPPRPSTGAPLLPALLLGAVAWLFLFVHLQRYWTPESYYNYGWFVPFLGGYLLLRRLQERPAPGPAYPGLLVPAVALLLLTPVIGMLGEALSHWRLSAWVFALSVFTATLGILLAMGGKRWAGWFFFALLFMLTAVPWPSGLEGRLVADLTEVVVVFVTRVLLFVGLPAERIGNVIEIGEATVTVGDVCSGVRSLQALVMVAFFIGELYRQSIARRIVLIVCGALVAFGFNCLRALALSFIAVYKDAAAFDEWHDWVGGIAFLLSILTLFGLSELIQKRGQESPPEERSAPARPTLPRWGAGLCMLGLLGVLAMEAASEAWFRWHEYQREQGEEWRLVWNAEAPAIDSLEFLDIPPDVPRLLVYDKGELVELRTADGTRMEVYNFAWTDGQQSLSTVFGHTPEICMVQYGGGSLDNRESGFDLPVGEETLRFTGYEISFPHAGRTLHAFRTLWLVGESGGVDPAEAERAFQPRSHWVNLQTAAARALEGVRTFHIKQVLVGVHDRDSLDSAWEELAPVLQGLLEPIDETNPPAAE